MHKILQECAKKKYPHDTRMVTKFADVATRMVKGDAIKMSLDYLQSNDYEMAASVLGAVDMVKEMVLFSDKCTLREIQKCQEEFEKEIKKTRQKCKVSIWKYIKDSDNPAGKKDSDDEGEEEEKAGGQSEMYDNVVSQNPKINY